MTCYSLISIELCQSLDKSIDKNKKEKTDASIDEKGVWRISSGREAEQWNRALEEFTWGLLNDWDDGVLVYDLYFSLS